MPAGWRPEGLPTAITDGHYRRVQSNAGAGVTRENVRQLVLYTGATEVHVGSGCHEEIPTTFPKGESVCLGFTGEGGI